MTKEQCPDCRAGEKWLRNGPTGAQETCKHPWHKEALTSNLRGLSFFTADEHGRSQCVYHAADVDAEVERLETKLKRYEPVNTYDGRDIDSWRSEALRLRAAAITACSEMGCYCPGEHDSTPPEMRSALCRLGDLVSDDGSAGETSPKPGVDDERVRLLEIEMLAKEMIQEMRLTPNGLIVRERPDKSDAHYRLCAILWPKGAQETNKDGPPIVLCGERGPSGFICERPDGHAGRHFDGERRWPSPEKASGNREFKCPVCDRLDPHTHGRYA